MSYGTKVCHCVGGPDCCTNHYWRPEFMYPHYWREYPWQPWYYRPGYYTYTTSTDVKINGRKAD